MRRPGRRRFGTPRWRASATLQDVGRANSPARTNASVRCRGTERRDRRAAGSGSTVSSRRLPRHPAGAVDTRRLLEWSEVANICAGVRVSSTMSWPRSSVRAGDQSARPDRAPMTYAAPGRHTEWRRLRSAIAHDPGLPTIPAMVDWARSRQPGCQRRPQAVRLPAPQSLPVGTRSGALVRSSGPPSKSRTG